MVFVLYAISIILALAILSRLSKISVSLSNIEKIQTDHSAWTTHCTNKIQDKIQQISLEVNGGFTKINARLNQSIEACEQQKAAKPNNWDSVREAFKLPTKVDINERS